MTKPAAGLQSWNIGRTTGALRESHLGWNVKKAIYVQVCFLLSTKRRSRKTAFFLYIFFFLPPALLPNWSVRNQGGNHIRYTLLFGIILQLIFLRAKEAHL